MRKTPPKNIRRSSPRIGQGPATRSTGWGTPGKYLHLLLPGFFDLNGKTPTAEELEKTFTTTVSLYDEVVTPRKIYVCSSSMQ